MNVLKEKYIKEIVPTLKEKHNYKSVMEVPKLEKIVINIGVGEANNDHKLLDAAVRDLSLISGQKPVITKTMSIPLTFTTSSNLISLKTNCSLIPSV